MQGASPTLPIVNRPPKILVVDDQPVNIALMQKKLEREGMTVLTASSGDECLAIVAQDPPDLILLDVMMPGMDGTEVCAALKEHPDTSSIPVIFLTANTSKKDLIEGLAVGAVDYITKPVDLEETLARVRAQLRYHEIFQQNLELTRRLSESRRAAAIGALSQGISHNLNNLLGVIYGYLELAKVNVQKPDLVRKHLDKIEDAVTRMTRVIRQVTTVSTKMQVSLLPIAADRLITSAIERFRADSQSPVEIVVHNDAGGAQAMANVEVFEDALTKIITNAVESYGTTPPPGAQVEIETELRERDGRAVVEFRVLDRGNGLDPRVRDHVFEPFVSTKSTVGVGMGLTIARHGIRNLGGEIQLKDRPGGGALAVFHIPLATSSVTASAA